MPRADQRVRDRNCIEHMLRYCEQVQESLGEIERDKERFLSSHTYQNAIAMCILQIGELTKQLSPEFLNDHKVIPWKLIAKTRDNYAHHYGAVDFELVWNTALCDIPEVERFCRTYLEKAKATNDLLAALKEGTDSFQRDGGLSIDDAFKL